MRELRRRRQDLELRLHEDVTDNLLSLTAAGELDLSLAALPIDREQMHVEPMFSEPLLVTVSRSHPLATKPKLALADIRDERFILLHEVHCLAEQIEAFCHDNKFSPKVACRSAQIATVQEMISLGQGLSMLPAMARAADTNKKRVYRELGKKTPTRTVVALWHRQRRQNSRKPSLSPGSPRSDQDVRERGCRLLSAFPTYLTRWSEMPRSRNEETRIGLREGVQ